MLLTTVLRIAAVLVTFAGTAEYVLLGEFLAPPFVVAVMLVVVSFAYTPWPRPTAIVALGFSALIPVGAVVGHLRGDLPLAVPIFDTIVFGWVFWNALAVVRASSESADVR